MKRCILELKNIKLYYIIPVIATCVLVPLIVVAEIVVNGCIDVRSLVKMYEACQMYIPWFGVWWPVFIMKSYLNSPGKELLFIYRFKYDNLAARMILLWLWYCVHISILFLIMYFLFHQVMIFFLLVTSQSLLLICAAYLIAMISRNTFIPLIMTFGYCLVFWMIIRTPVLNIFVFDLQPDNPAFVFKAIWLTSIAVLFLGLGHLIERRLYKNRI